MTIRNHIDWPGHAAGDPGAGERGPGDPVPHPPHQRLLPGTGAGPYDWLEGELFAHRRVAVVGELDDALAGEVVARLMTLDATGDDPVEVQLNASGTALDAAFAVMDTIDLLGVEVRTTCVGRAEGTAVGVLAVSSRRRVAVNARLRLCEPTLSAHGDASRLSSWAEHVAGQLARFHQRLAQATGRRVEDVAADLRRGRWLSAPEAVDYGLADEVAAPDARIYPWRRRGELGFRPDRRPPGQPPAS